MLEDIFQPHYY